MLGVIVFIVATLLTLACVVVIVVDSCYSLEAGYGLLAAIVLYFASAWLFAIEGYFGIISSIMPQAVIL